MCRQKKSYGRKNSLPFFWRWDNGLESSVTEIVLEKTSEAPVVHPPAQNSTRIHTSGQLLFKTLCWKLYKYLSQCFTLLAVKKVFLKSNLNLLCCNIGLSEDLCLWCKILNFYFLLCAACQCKPTGAPCLAILTPTTPAPGQGGKNPGCSSPAKCL